MPEQEGIDGHAKLGPVVYRRRSRRDVGGGSNGAATSGAAVSRAADTQGPIAVQPLPPATLVFPNNTNALANLKPRVVCGMTLIPAPPGVDPKIGDQREAEKPKTPTRYTIRPVQPSICW
jgi:hypothetical protein